MKISTEIASASAFLGEEKAIEEIAKAGFEAWDFSMFKMRGYNWDEKRYFETDHPLAKSNYISFARKLKKVGLDNGIVCNQAHAPNPASYESELYLKRAIECTAEAGGKYCVIHPLHKKTDEENAEFYHMLLPTAKAFGVKIACENMWQWDHEKDQSCYDSCCNSTTFTNVLNLVNDDYLVACLDIGHSEMKGSGGGAVNMIKALGDKLQVLHIHDNDKWHDSHQLPLTMDIDYDEVVKALKEIGYNGDLTLEANAYLKNYKGDTLTGIKNLASSAKKLREIYENI